MREELKLIESPGCSGHNYGLCSVSHIDVSWLGNSMQFYGW